MYTHVLTVNSYTLQNIHIYQCGCEGVIQVSGSRLPGSAQTCCCVVRRESDSDILQRVEEELDSCDLCLVVSSFELDDVLSSNHDMFFSLCVNFW